MHPPASLPTAWAPQPGQGHPQEPWDQGWHRAKGADMVGRETRLSCSRHGTAQPHDHSTAILACPSLQEP